MKKILHLLFIFPIIALIAMSFASCSEDDTPTTGVLKITFSYWEPDWGNNVTLKISTLEKPETAIKIVSPTPSRNNKIELNPGNYILNCSVAGVENPQILLWNKAVQIQAGKTETVVAGKD